MTKVKHCESCGESFEYERSSARFCPTCNTDAARQRRRRGTPDPTARVPTEHRWDRKGGLDVVDLPGDPERGVSEKGIAHPSGFAGRKRLDGAEGNVGLVLGEAPGDPADDFFVAWKLAASDEQYERVMWELIWEQAMTDLLWCLYPILREPEYRPLEAVASTAVLDYDNARPALVQALTRAPQPRGKRIWLGISRDQATLRWLIKYLTHTDLTVAGRLTIVSAVPEAFVAVLKAAKEKEKPVIETVAAQNEEILAKLGCVLDGMDELLERVRERFPNDAEVSAAVDRLLEDLS
jgi:hypothetical protein